LAATPGGSPQPLFRNVYAENDEFQVVVDQLLSEGGKRNRRRYNLAKWQTLGWDKNSLFADLLFIDPANHDSRVRSESPALKVGFANFEMGRWGLTEEFPEK